MATYQYEKRRMMRQYPSLFRNEWDVLHHLFFVNGNGYDWQNGQLDSPFKESDIEVLRRRGRRELDTACDMVKLCSAYPEQGRGWSDRLAQDRKHFRKGGYAAVGRLVDQRDRLEVDRSTRLYSICQYACIWTMPGGVAEDWLTAGELAYQLAQREEIEKTATDVHWLKRIGKHLRQLRKLKG